MTDLAARSHVNILYGYGFGVAVWLFASLGMGPVAGLHLGLTTLVLFLMASPISQRNVEGDWPRFVAQWLTPVMLWILQSLSLRS